MQLLSIFAGVPTCSPQEQTEKTIAFFAAFAIFCGLVVFAGFLFRLIMRSKLNGVLKFIFGLLLIFGAVLFCVGIPMIFLVLSATVCY